MVKHDTATAKSVKELILGGIDLAQGRLEAQSDGFWKGLRDAGTELWLDTGDMDDAASVWSVPSGYMVPALVIGLGVALLVSGTTDRENT